jgi:hypothetical protein
VHARSGGVLRRRRHSAGGRHDLRPTALGVSKADDRRARSEIGHRPSPDVRTAGSRGPTDGRDGVDRRRTTRGARAARPPGVRRGRRPGAVRGSPRGARDRPGDDDVHGPPGDGPPRYRWGHREAGRVRLPGDGADDMVDPSTGASGRRRGRHRRGRVGGRGLDGGGCGGHRGSRRGATRRCGGRRGSRGGRRGLHDCGRGFLNGRRTGRRIGRRGRRRDRAGRQQPERVDVALLVRGPSDPEVDARDGRFRRAAQAHRPDRRPLGDRVALSHDDRPEVDERDGVAVGREDRDAAPVGRQRARERHDARRRRPDGRAVRAGDVEAAVLPARIGVRAERERAEDRAVRGPRPGCRLAAQGERERRDQANRKEPVHSCTSFVLCDGNAGGER